MIFKHQKERENLLHCQNGLNNKYRYRMLTRMPVNWWFTDYFVAVINYI